jgi:pimeloyl-ACP methyl ester carboxylesterase
MTLAGTTIDVRGRSTEVRVDGTGEPLVHLHGGGIVEGLDFLTALSDRFRVVAPLLPGYGSTELDPPISSREDVAGTRWTCSTHSASSGRSWWATRWADGGRPTSRPCTRSG